jgi:predicted DNA-binding protein
MATLELDNETTALLAEMAENEHTTLAKLANRLLIESLEDWQDARAADKALAELERGEDAVISFEEWEHQLDGMAH